LDHGKDDGGVWAITHKFESPRCSLNRSLAPADCLLCLSKPRRTGRRFGVSLSKRSSGEHKVRRARALVYFDCTNSELCVLGNQ